MNWSTTVLKSQNENQNQPSSLKQFKKKLLISINLTMSSI